jgi:hypothetical protein
MKTPLCSVLSVYSNSETALDFDAANTLTDARENFPGNRFGGYGMIEGCDGLVALTAQDNDLIARHNAFYFGHINYGLIHTDTTHEGCALSVHEQTEMIA